MIKYTLGWLMIFEAAFFLVPMITAVIYNEWGTLLAFGITAAICLCLGGLCVFKSPKNTTIYAREGFIIVSLSWIMLSVFGALPFVIDGCEPNFINALFEAASGFTTTGSSIFREVESLPKAMEMLHPLDRRYGSSGIHYGFSSPLRRSEYAHYACRVTRTRGIKACSQS